MDDDSIRDKNIRTDIINMNKVSKDRNINDLINYNILPTSFVKNVWK